MTVANHRVRVWDAPTRIFHWSLVAALTGAWFTRDARYLDFHEFLGYAIGALVAFRIAWGFAGTRWARFASFAPSISSGLRYLAALSRGRQAHYAGHNPAGSLSIFALLGLAALEVATGVVALGAEKGQGLLAGRFGYPVGDVAHAVHQWLAYAMLAIVALHIGGVVVGCFADRQNLVAAMLTGRKQVDAEVAGVDARRGIAVGIAIALALGALAYFRGYLMATATRPYRPYVSPALPLDATWQNECGGCHLAFHPSLLPRRSWAKMLAEQQTHFGEDLGLGDATLRHLEAYAAANAAEALESPVAWKMATTIPADSAPLRISATPYWVERHSRLETATWTRVHRSECENCHRDADAGTFAPGAIDLELGKSTVRKGK